MYDFKIKGGSHENDEKHRDQLIRDMIYVCCLPHFSDKNRREFINVSISWSFSDRYELNIEQTAKYKGCPYWSEEALKKLNEGAKWDASGLRHEHIVPRRIFIEAIDEHFKDVRDEIKKGADIEEVANREFKILHKLMNDNIKGCVVTKDESDIIDGKVKGTKGDGPYKKDMPESAYKNAKPDNAWLQFSEIDDAWARYRRVKNEISIYKINWKFNDKSKRWETDLETKERVI